MCVSFCPHLGAHLAGGRVCKDRIECPFHGWHRLTSRSPFIGSPSAACRDFWCGVPSEAGSPSGATMSTGR
ncbi:Rieske 2Fe-2S domain-containing protein [Candidatus Palauibacter sp.]|uniref:Rieske 2Fe-2S domain-containing protein n=1 Tax=Candidatus Palauibacter sp. TaxID=3101350 RepID=UPI003B0193DD